VVNSSGKVITVFSNPQLCTRCAIVNTLAALCNWQAWAAIDTTDTIRLPLLLLSLSPLLLPLPGRHCIVPNSPWRC
jgi:hypothetical protein